MQSFSPVCIMEHMSTLQRIRIIVSDENAAAIHGETEAARSAFAAMGFDVKVLTADPSAAGTARTAGDVRGTLPADVYAYDTLCIADSSAAIGILKEKGAAAAGYAHERNADDRLAGAEYVLSELSYIDRDSLEKIWQRQRDLPWQILTTRRCLVREFVPEDLEGIMDLYDPEARRFLTPPSKDLKKEREILKAYIDRVYRLGGYGDWAVILIESGELIGRVGFSFPIRQGGLPPHDAALGYLIRADHRREGIALEVCRAELQYGFEMLGFTAVIAETDEQNTASQMILKRLGFEPAAHIDGKKYFIANASTWRKEQL